MGDGSREIAADRGRSREVGGRSREIAEDRTSSQISWTARTHAALAASLAVGPLDLGDLGDDLGDLGDLGASEE